MSTNFESSFYKNLTLKRKSEMYEDPQNSPSHVGTASGMDSNSSSSGFPGGTEPITDILRHKGPPRSESLGRLEDDHDQNEESHINVDADGGPIGARVSRTHRTPFGPINGDGSMQMRIGRGGVSILTTRGSSLASGGHGRTILISTSGRSAFGGMDGAMSGPFGGMFSPLGGLMSPFGRMHARGNGLFGHISSHGMGNMFSTTDNYSGPIIKEIDDDDVDDDDDNGGVSGDEDDDDDDDDVVAAAAAAAADDDDDDDDDDDTNQLEFSDKSDRMTDEKENDTSVGLDLLPPTEDSDEEYKPPGTHVVEIVTIQNEGELGSKNNIPSSASPVNSEPQTSLDGTDDRFYVSQEEKELQNNTKGYSEYAKSTYFMPDMRQEPTLCADSFSSLDEKTSVSNSKDSSLNQGAFTSPEKATIWSSRTEQSSNKNNKNLFEVDTVDLTDQQETSLFAENWSPLEETPHHDSVQYSSDNIVHDIRTLPLNRDDPVDQLRTALGGERFESVSTHEEEVATNFKLRNSLLRNAAKSSKKKFSKQKFYDVKFGFGDRKTLHQEIKDTVSHKSFSTAPSNDKQNEHFDNFESLPNYYTKEKTQRSVVVRDRDDSKNRNSKEFVQQYELDLAAQQATDTSCIPQHLGSIKTTYSALSSRRNTLSSHQPKRAHVHLWTGGTGVHIDQNDLPPNCTCTCKHQNTHWHDCSCCNRGYYHCNDCGAAFEEHTNTNAAMPKTKKPRNKNAFPRAIGVDSMDATDSDPLRARRQSKSATGPPLKALVESIGLKLKDVYPDGNCLFTSVVDQLRIRGDFSYTARDLRQAAVDYLEAHPNQEDGTSLSEFLTDHERNWDKYLSSMRQDGHWGDHHTIWALANVLNKKIIIYRGEKELHRTVVEPHRNRLDNTVNSDKEMSKDESCDDKENQSDLEQMHLGHISDSHYVSLRQADWHEKLMIELKTRRKSVIIGCNPASRNLEFDDMQADVPRIHFNFAMKYILLSDIIFTRKESTEDQAARRQSKPSPRRKCDLEMYVPLLDKMNCCVIGNQSVESIINEESTMVLNIPLDTKVFNSRSGLVTQKDLLAYSDKHMPGCTKLRPIDWSLWMTETDDDRFLRHLLIDSRENRSFLAGSQTKLLLAFQSEWPVAAEEWRYRKRAFGWPSELIVDRVVSASGRVIPADLCVLDSNGTQDIKEETLESNNASTVWQYIFDKAEKIMGDEALTADQLDCFHIIKVLLDHILGDSKLPLSLLKHVFFYVCEETESTAWINNPAICIHAFLDHLCRCLKSRFVPSYFLPAINLLTIKDERDLSRMLDCLEIARDNPFMSLYFTFEHFNQIFVLINRLFDSLVEDARRYVHNSDIETSVRTCFVPLVSDGISILISEKKFGIALDRCKRAALYLEAITHGSVQISLENILTKSLYRSVPQLERWLFAFYVDQMVDTDLTESVCEGHQTAFLSDYFGSSLGDYLHVSEDIMIPAELVSNDKLAGTTIEFMTVLKEELLIPFRVYKEIILFFLNNHAQRLINFASTKREVMLQVKILVETVEIYQLKSITKAYQDVLEQFK